MAGSADAHGLVAANGTPAGAGVNVKALLSGLVTAGALIVVVGVAVVVVVGAAVVVVVGAAIVAVDVIVLVGATVVGLAAVGVTVVRAAVGVAVLAVVCFVPDAVLSAGPSFRALDVCAR